jgi:hypothetical protein
LFQVRISIYIEKRRRILLSQTAKLLGVSQKDLLSFLIKKSRLLFSNTATLFKAVQYQRNTDDGDFSVKHVSFYAVDYEYVTGKRFFFKFSVSFIIRMAIDRFLNEIIEKGLDNSVGEINKIIPRLTNYYYDNYYVLNIQNIDVEFWVVPWQKREQNT